MELDLLPESVTDEHSVLPGNLLSNLPRRGLIIDEHPSETHSPETSGFQQLKSNQAGVVISKIEDIFESIADCILDEKNEMVIRLKTRRRSRAKVGIDGEGIGNDQTRAVRFPSKNPQEAWKFTALLQILTLSHEALATGVVMTKRDIYYRDPELFMKQAVVDRYVDDIAHTFGVQRDSLNIVAAAKGLIAGAFRITKENDSVVDYGSELEGILIPNTKDVRSIHLLDVRWILVIEKEATFRTLSTTQYWKSSSAGKGIIMTAKGYPDIQTRQFLYFLSTQVPCVPIHCLVDFDPDGFGIMSTYKHGSKALAHQNANLAVSSIQWLGVRSCDIMLKDVGKTGLLKLTKRDRRIAMKMLEKEIFLEGQWKAEVEWRRELQVMLMLNLKAEIQVLSPNEGGLEGWLDGRLMGKMD